MLAQKRIVISEEVRIEPLHLPQESILSVIQAWRFALSLSLRFLFEIIFVQVNLVRLKGPGLQPEQRYEFEKVDPQMQNIRGGF